MTNPLDLGFDSDDIIKESDKIREFLPTIREWITNSSNNVPTNLTNSQLILFIVACQYDEEAIKQCISSYYEVRQKTPELFSNRNIQSVELQKQLSAVEFYISPVPTDEGYTVVFTRYLPNCYKNYDTTAALKLNAMVVDLLAFKYCYKGIIHIQDMKHVGVNFLWKLKIPTLASYIGYMQNCIPLRFIAMHGLNAPSFCTYVVGLVKRFVNNEKFNLAYFHPVGMKMDEFYEKHVPKKCLPSDYGGDQLSVAEMNVKVIQELEELQSYFDVEEQQRNCK